MRLFYVHPDLTSGIVVLIWIPVLCVVVPGFWLKEFINAIVLTEFDFYMKIRTMVKKYLRQLREIEELKRK